jgi:uncharacterized protein YcbX
MWLSAITRYPVKSLRGQALSSTPIEARGIAGDRRWMVVDERHRFVTRRELPAMALLEAHPTPGGLALSHPTGTCHAIIPDDDATVVDATIWRDTLAVRLGNDVADAFLSRVLNRPVRLAYQFEASRRAIDRQYAGEDDHVSLADGFPLLVTSTASLDALNARLTSPVTMDRFRPNLVIAGAEPWAEDRWRRVRIGTVELRLARPCARCIVVTQQPDTGERLEGNEPLATLRAMGRFVEGGIMFGQNAIPDRLNTVRVGDEVEILEEGESNVRVTA